jgi:hypothetical protein
LNTELQDLKLYCWILALLKCDWFYAPVLSFWSKSFDFFFFFFFKDLFINYVYSVLPAHMPAGKKRTPDLITDGYKPPFGCWELKSGPL